MDAELKNIEFAKAQIEGSKKALDEAKKDVGIAMRRQREKIGMSLRALADKVTCSVAFLSDIELGRRYPSKEVLSDILKALKSPSKVN